MARTAQKEMKRSSVMVPVRITREQDSYLQTFVRNGMFSSRQEAIRFFISEKMLRDRKEA